MLKMSAILEAFRAGLLADAALSAFLTAQGYPALSVLVGGSPAAKLFHYPGPLVILKAGAYQTGNAVPKHFPTVGLSWYLQDNRLKASDGSLYAPGTPEYEAWTFEASASYLGQENADLFGDLVLSSLQAQTRNSVLARVSYSLANAEDYPFFGGNAAATLEIDTILGSSPTL
jgi:hypothetical protein